MAVSGAALAGDGPALIRHAALAIELQAAASGNYLTLLAQLLQALALAQRLREGAPAERGALQRELDACHDWLALRAADAPVNFLHLVHWIEAERAWALDDSAARHWPSTPRCTPPIRISGRGTRP